MPLILWLTINSLAVIGSSAKNFSANSSSASDSASMSSRLLSAANDTRSVGISAGVMISLHKPFEKMCNISYPHSHKQDKWKPPVQRLTHVPQKNTLPYFVQGQLNPEIHFQSLLESAMQHNCDEASFLTAENKFVGQLLFTRVIQPENIGKNSPSTHQKVMHKSEELF
jgi:hypothetical protein